MQGTSGKKMHAIYTAAWEMGLKTTYYLRTMAVSQIEKSTLDAMKYYFTQKRSYQNESSAALPTATGKNSEKLKPGGQKPATHVTNFKDISPPHCEVCT
jgi:ribonucleoside-diphosphate reductase alpha chain